MDCRSNVTDSNVTDEEFEEYMWILEQLGNEKVSLFVWFDNIK
jgi:hypothetical protein